MGSSGSASRGGKGRTQQAVWAELQPDGLILWDKEEEGG